MISKEPLPWNEHQRDPINSVLLVDARDELTNARKYNQEINEAGNGKEKKKIKNNSTQNPRKKWLYPFKT